MPDAQWNDARHFASGDRACSEWRFTCTLPNGTKVEKFGCDLFHIRDGKIHIKNTLRMQMPAYCPGDNEIVNVVEFTADKLPNGSQCAILFKFGSDDLITEERWFVDTEQWKAAF
jgi:hypothetical protein